MKKHFLIALALLIAVLSFSSCGHEHAWSEWTTVNEATCTEEGLKERVCECGEKETQKISANGHTPGAEATCTEAQSCTVCNTELAKALGHAPGKEATCTEAQSCTVCNAELAKALGHTPGKEATCTEAQSCTVCNAELVKVLGHTEVVDASVAPTCTTTGLTRGKHCSVCGEITVEQTVVKALGHTEETIPSIAPTCTEEGLTEGKRCAVCQEVIVMQNTVPIREHSYNSVGTCRYCGSNVLDTLKSYVMLYGTYRDGYYLLEVGNSYSSDYSYEYTRYVYYYPDDDELTFDLRTDSLTSDFSHYLYFTVDILDSVYSYSSFDNSDYTMRGTLYANSFTDNTLVGYSGTNIPSSLRSSFRELTSAMVGLLLRCINEDLAEFGIDAQTLGFYYY